MRRIVLLTSMALMLAAAMALSGVAQAKPITNGKADAKCLAEAIRTLGPGFNPSDYTFYGGTEGFDFFYIPATAGHNVFCGFGGHDEADVLVAGDIFLGGDGNDVLISNFTGGTFYGGAGDDLVSQNFGTFYGGDGNDIAFDNLGTFYGGAGDDYAENNYEGATFNGGDGNDSVTTYNKGTLVDVEVAP